MQKAIFYIRFFANLGYIIPLHLSTIDFIIFLSLKINLEKMGGNKNAQIYSLRLKNVLVFLPQ